MLDLWEYKLPLTEAETDFMVSHLWEVIKKTGFRYYFFDENCSYYLVRLLEAIKPEWNFKIKDDLFVVPIDTIKDFHENIEQVKVSHYRPS